MPKLKKLASPAAICLIAMLLAVTCVIAAGYWINSNVVTVTVSEYTLPLTVDNSNPAKNENVTFEVVLSLDGAALPGKTIEFRQNGVAIGTNVTDSSGLCTFRYNMTTKGSFDFSAHYWVP